jgi:Holliday junction resolvasome RuvABC endonuclease subunit
MSGIVVGIDPSLTGTGLVRLDRGELTQWGRYGKKLHAQASYQARAERMTFTLASVLHEVPRNADLVVIEGMAYNAGGDFHTDPDVFGLWWHVFTHLHARGVPIAVIPPTTLKVWITGRPAGGKADKTEILETASKWWPEQKMRSHDVADAAGLATLGAAHLGHPTPFRLGRRHHEVLHGSIAWPKQPEVLVL